MDRRNFLIIGIGATGRSVARHLSRLGQSFRVADTREDVDLVASWLAEFPRNVPMMGPLSPDLLKGIDEVVVSPGVAVAGAFFAAARTRGISVRSDVDICLADADIPHVLVTGSNGKSTVTALTGALFEAVFGSEQVGVGGNFGIPALDLLERRPAVMVLEVSSFQLESTAVEHLRATAATVLNISQDHLDRHGTLDQYAAIKAKVLVHTACAVINRDDPRVAAMGRALSDPERIVRFGGGAAERATDFGLCLANGASSICRGAEALLPTAKLGLMGLPNLLNVQAALALFAAVCPDVDLHDPRIARALADFRGLPHRSQLIAEIGGVLYIDDSKATNVGAAVAALSGIDGPVVLIAGGQGKGQDFAPLAETIAHRDVLAVVLIGQDRARIRAALAVCATTPLFEAADMSAAVRTAAAHARPGTVVLLSPACASFDQFAGYADRGRRFAEAVDQLERPADRREEVS